MTYREISVFGAWRLWRNLKYLYMCSNFKFIHMKDVYISKISQHVNFRFLHTTDFEKYEISPLLACVWCDKCQHMQMQCYFVMKSVCWNFTHFCREICIVVNLGTLCVKKKISKNCISGEKITNMRSAPFWQCQYFHWNC